MHKAETGPGLAHFHFCMEKLIYIDDSLPGITRRGAGRGFAYYDAQGALITDPAEKRRLNAIALPPAYEDCWFCPAPNGHILAMGYDARGRKQYRYHPDFRLQQEGRKFDLCLPFGTMLPLLRQRVEQDIAGPRLTAERAIASVVRLLDLGAVRVGNEFYSRTNNSFGATTLRRRHASVRGKMLTLRYKGKGGKQRDLALNDAQLAQVVRQMQDLPGQNLFKFRAEDGEFAPVSSDDVNTYLRETMGDDFTAKHFRTWHASVKGLECLYAATAPIGMNELLECVSSHLGNTPAIARKSYIHPAIIALVDQQHDWKPGFALPRVTKWQSRYERGLIAVLAESPRAAKLLAA